MLGPLTRLQCCSPTCGGAAAVIVSENFARRKGIRADIVIRGQAMRTDFPSTFEENSLIKVVGADMSAVAAKSGYETSEVGSASCGERTLQYGENSGESDKLKK